MVALNDQTIIDNTHFKEEDGKLVCYTNLPGEEQFSQEVGSKESVQKNMIGWCNTVREYLKAVEVAQEEERLAKKRRQVPAPPAASPQGTATHVDAKQQVLTYFDELQTEIDLLGEEIATKKDKRNALRKERDDLKPIITVWRGE